MDAEIRNRLINGGLQLAFDLTGLFPGLAEVHGALQIAADIAPILEAELEWAQTDEGKRAIAHVQRLFAALSGAMPHATFATPAVQESKYPGWKLEWDALQGYQWVKEANS